MTKKISYLILICFMFSLATVALAQTNIPQLENQNKAFLNNAGLGTKSITIVVSDIIKIFLSFLGIIFIVLILYAGYNWMTAAGNEDKIGKAKQTIVASIIGLAIIMAAYTITYFIIDVILETTKGGQGLD